MALSYHGSRQPWGSRRPWPGRPGRQTGAITPRQAPSDSGRFSAASGVLDGCFDVVVDAGCGQQSVRAALEDGDSGLGRQVVAAPAEAVVFQSAAHAVVGHGAVLESDATARAEVHAEERAELVRAAMGVFRAGRL